MFKVFILITIIIGVRSQAPFYGQCGGLNWQGPRTCIIGSTCKIQSIYYSQCEPDPQNQNNQVQVLYGQCGGISWSGPKTCVSWATCQYQSEYYSQCVPATITNLITTTKFYESEAPLYGQCGGVNWSGSKKCVPGTKCEYINDYYSQCLPYKQTQIPTQPPQTTTIEDQVPLNGQCDSISWERQKTCAAGLKCEFVSDYYSHCIPSYTTTQTTNTETTKETKNTETTIEIERTTTNESVTLPPFPVSVFPGTTFKHGLEYSKNVASDEYSKYDYISIWINQPWSSLPTKTDFDPNYHGEMIKLSLKLKKLPIFYSYIIGFEAKAYMGLNHCKVDLIYNLCHFGSGFVRAYRNLLVTRYTHQATEIAKFLNDKNSPCIFLIEPDFWQYYGNEAQHEGVLSGEYMRILFDDFVEEIKKQLPNAMISWDLGSWKDEKNFTKWWNYFKSSPFIDFVHTSSGQGQADSNQYKENELKWIDYSRITGKRIIAGCGFTTDGTESANCGIWNLENKKLRVNDGVIALTQKSKQNEPNFDRLTLQIF